MKSYSKNRKARHDYSFIKTYEAGMKLSGAQVKSVRAGTISLLGSYISIEQNRVILKQVTISEPPNLGYMSNSFDEKAEIYLLLNKKEISEMLKLVQERGISIIPLEVHQPKDTKTIKVKIAVAKGKRDYDKRNDLKEKTQKRDVEISLKGY